MIPPFLTSTTNSSTSQGFLARAFGIFSTFACLGIPGVCSAQSVQAPTSDPSTAAELASFQLHEDFEINLFADESMGIANPIAIHWDREGRLWVLTTLAYAQLTPGENPDDKLFILEDSNNDGKADKVSVFADGLDMPTGFALGHGGAFIGQGADLLFIKDTDGDGKADEREVVLSGFGFGDTHQNISNLTWGPDGKLYFCQGLHTYSRVETPWGIAKGDTAGFWRFDPVTLKLEPFGFPALVSQNPCGVILDKEGNLFIKSNNRELIFATPSLIPTTHQLDLVPIASIGVTPGKSMGGEYVESSHLPDWIQNHILIAGYYSHRVTAFPLVEDGAGFARVTPEEILVSNHESFRPVDIRIGPDGAIYVADWFNPIIGHYQASLRHPDRDKSHGRIWRITAKGRDRANIVPLPVAWIPGNESEETGPASEPSRSFAEMSPNMRLRTITQWANRPEADSLVMALRAIDEPTDRFIDYALTQATHALAPYWLPAVKSGEIDFEKPEHLAFALEALGGTESATIAREKVDDEGIDPATRSRFAQVLAKVGSPEDLRTLLDRPHPDTSILDALAESWPSRQQRPAPPFAPRLGELLKDDQPEIRSVAVKLAGLWQVKPLAPPVRKLALDPDQPHGVRIPALHATARLEGKGSTEAIGKIAEDTDTPLILRRGAVEALCLVDLPRAARDTAAIFSEVEPSALTNGFLLPFLNRKGGPDVLAAALSKATLSSAQAQPLVTALSEMGRAEPKLSAVLNEALGVQASAALAYSPDFVTKLATEVRASGDAKAGKDVFQRAQLTCVACHQIGGMGGILGPNLDTVGAGLPLDLIIESVLWPDRQLKEGYFALSVTTKDGQILTGYEEKEAEGILWLRDTATGQTKPIPPGQIAERKNIGTLMPPGLTVSLSRDELRDLIAYLASLKGDAK